MAGALLAAMMAGAGVARAFYRSPESCHAYRLGFIAFSTPPEAPRRHRGRHRSAEQQGIASGARPRRPVAQARARGTAANEDPHAVAQTGPLDHGGASALAALFTRRLHEPGPCCPCQRARCLSI